MKKIVLIVTFLSIFLLTGCSNQTEQAAKQAKIEQQRNKQIKQNRQVWNKKVVAAKNVDQPNYQKYITNVPSGYKDENMSLGLLKNGNQAVVKAQVVNLQPEMGRLFTPETKATIYIEQVISGDKALQGKTTKTEFSGGLSKARDYFNSFEGEYVGKDYGVKNPKQVIYTTNPTVPMPKIGQKMIIGIKKYHPETKDREKLYQKYGLTTQNSYTINNPEVTYWVEKAGKFKLNNPAFYQKQNKNKYPKLFKVTKELNTKYGK